jgi:catechol 2,3-dioxygenase-like lactoylglutathione lyase family enzyme
MLYELNHFGIVVRDLDASLAFYEGLLGARTVFRRFVDSTQTHVLYLQLGDSLIELLHPLHPAEDVTTGITHIAFMSGDLDGDYTSLIHAGVPSISEPRTAATGVGRLAFVRDPNGVGVELLQRDLAMRGERLEHPIVAGFDHYSLTVDDPDAAYGFYAGLLGMRAEKPADSAVDSDATVRLSMAGQVLELRGRTAELADDPTFSHFALRVHDLGTSLDTLARHGFEAERAAEGAVIRDPDGVAIVLLPALAAAPAAA